MPLLTGFSTEGFEDKYLLIKVNFVFFGNMHLFLNKSYYCIVVAAVGVISSYKFNIAAIAGFFVSGYL